MENEIAPTCYCCKSEYHSTDKYCGKCGYPFYGTPEEQKQFSIDYTLKSFGKDVVKDRVKEARVILYVIAVFTLISAFIVYSQDQSHITLFINILLAITYGIMGFWARNKPFAAIFTGTLIYLSIIILSAIVSPITIFHGIIFKVIFTIALVKASYSASKLK